MEEKKCEWFGISYKGAMKLLSGNDFRSTDFYDHLAKDNCPHCKKWRKMAKENNPWRMWLGGAEIRLESKRPKSKEEQKIREKITKLEEQIEKEQKKNMKKLKQLYAELKEIKKKNKGNIK